jgi:glycosyltransferase involved in cell wall biosynthesis
VARDREGGGSRVTPRFTVVRGVERINFGELGIYARLSEHGFSPELLCARGSRVREEDAGMPIRRLPTPQLAGRLTSTLAGGYLVGRVSPVRYYHQYLRGFHRAVRDSTILCPVDLGHPSSYQAVRERRNGKRVLVQCWDNIPYNWPHDRPLRDHYEAVLDGADKFLAMTDDADRTLRAEGVVRERILRLNMGLRVDIWRPSSEARTRREPLELLFVGRIEWAKGIHTVLEAIELVSRPVRLTIVGAGSQESRLRWMIDQRKRRGNPTLDRSVRFVGPKYGAELLELRQHAEVQVVPSIPTPQWREQLNQSMLEGLACGLPAIVSEGGAVTEAVADHDNALLVPPDLPQRWAAAIDYFADHPDERERMGLRARERIEAEYNLDRQGPRLAELLRQNGLGAV